MPESWLKKTFDAHWSSVGKLGSFPRNPDGPSNLALPLLFVEPPRLRFGATGEWASHRRIVRPLGTFDRRFHARSTSFPRTEIFLPEKLRSFSGYEVFQFPAAYLRTRHPRINRTPGPKGWPFRGECCEVLSGFANSSATPFILCGTTYGEQLPANGGTSASTH